MYPFQEMLVGLAFSEQDGDLIRYARMIALHAHGIAVDFVHVIPPPQSTEEAPPMTENQAAKNASIAALMEENYLPAPAGGPCSLHVSEGPRVDRLLEFAAQEAKDLILIGHRPATTGRRSVARRLAMKAPASLWMVPAASPPQITRLLVAVDFSAESALALEAAAAIARAAGLNKIYAAHIYFDPAVARYEGYGAVIRGREREAFEEFAAPLNLHDISVEPIFQESSHVADALLRIAGTQKTDLIVMGSRGMSPAAAVLLGSESEHTLMHSGIPVLIVREPGSRVGLLRTIFGRDFPLKREPRFG